MKKIIIVLFCIIPLLITTGPTFAASPLKFEMSIGADYMAGDTTYQIGRKVFDEFGNLVAQPWFPISELEFPTDIFLATVSASLGSVVDTWKINASISTNITDDAGDMKDSDWVTGPNTLDIYSESDTDLDAVIFDIDFDYKFFKRKNFGLFAGVGYRRLDFEFEVSDTVQTYPSGLLAFGRDVIPGKTLTYDVDFNLFYLSFGSQFDIKDVFHIAVEVGYAPYAKATDRDNHLLRDRISKGDFDGDAILFNVFTRYDLTPHWFLTGEIDYQNIEVDGESETRIGGILDHSIYQEIESEQTTVSVAVGLSF